MATVPILSQPLDRNELQKFLPPDNFRLIKAFENLSIDVSTNIPENIEGNEAAIAAAQAAADAAQADANAAQATADAAVILANAAQSAADDAQADADALETKSYILTAPDAGVPNARGIVDGLGINFVDGGAGGSFTVLVDESALTLSNMGGAVTSSQLPILSAFSAHNNGVAQSIPVGAFTVLSMSTEAYDTQANFAANAWTPPGGRPITMTGSVTFNTGAGPLTVSIFKNGVEFKRGVQVIMAAVETSVTVSAQDFPAGADVYDLRVFQNTAGAQNTLGSSVKTFFQGAVL